MSSWTWPEAAATMAFLSVTVELQSGKTREAMLRVERISSMEAYGYRDLEDGSRMPCTCITMANGKSFRVNGELKDIVSEISELMKL